MEFGLEKFSVLVLKHRVKVHCEGFVARSGQVMVEIDENGYNYLVVLEGTDIMQKEMKEKFK